MQSISNAPLNGACQNIAITLMADQPGQSDTTEDERHETFTSAVTCEMPAAGQMPIIIALPPYLASECIDVATMLQVKERINDLFRVFYQSEFFGQLEGEPDKNLYTLLEREFNAVIDAAYFAGKQAHANPLGIPNNPLSMQEGETDGEGFVSFPVKSVFDIAEHTDPIVIVSDGYLFSSFTQGVETLAEMQRCVSTWFNAYVSDLERFGPDILEDSTQCYEGLVHFFSHLFPVVAQKEHEATYAKASRVTDLLIELTHSNAKINKLESENEHLRAQLAGAH